MRGSLSLIIALIVEIFLLIFIVIVLLVGVLGVFLPILPGLLLFGVAAAVYSLLIKSDFGTLTPRFHRKFLKVREKVLKLEIIKKIMKLTKRLKEKKREKIKGEILKHGIILLGFNTALLTAFIFGMVGLSFLSTLLRAEGILAAFFPLVFIFIFAGASGVVWYRFGQILGKTLEDKRIVNSSMVVLISFLPFLALVILLSGMISLVGAFTNFYLVVAFLGVLLMSILVAVFELLIINLGAITPTK